MAEHMVNLLCALEQRGHAAVGKVSGDQETSQGVNDKLKAVIGAVQPARSHPDWELTANGRSSADAQRSRLIDVLMQSVKNVVHEKLSQASTKSE
jgi:hypothetical protein